MISIKQDINAPWGPITVMDIFWSMIGNLQPIVVYTQAEYDYFVAMKLMIGRDFVVLLDGRDENTTGVPPTFAKVDLSLV